MPQYHFQLDGWSELPNIDSVEFASDLQAVIYAGRLAKELAANESNESPQQFLSVLREDGHEVTKVPIRKPGSLA